MAHSGGMRAVCGNIVSDGGVLHPHPFKWRQESPNSGRSCLRGSFPLADIREFQHIAVMRPVIIGLLAALIGGCGESYPHNGIDRIELRAAGLDISVNIKGDGRYLLQPSDRTGRATSFKIEPIGFKRLLGQLAPFQAKAGPTEEASRHFAASNCPKGVPYVTDAGMISIRWIGRDLDRIYIADFGCDYRRNAAQNGELRAILKSLPAPSS